MSLLCAFAIAAVSGCARGGAKPNVAVTPEAARQTALARVPGQVQEEELEQENGRWVYDIDIKPTDPNVPVQEVTVDANTGEIITVTNDD